MQLEDYQVEPFKNMYANDFFNWKIIRVEVSLKVFIRLLFKFKIAFTTHMTFRV